MEYFFLILISYISGSIPYGFLITKLIGYEDIRKLGSGNIGATNVLRMGNKKIAFIVLILDILKCYLPTLMSVYLFNENIGCLCGMFSIIGHIYPIWLRFRGGKGVACFYGMLLALNPMLFIIILAIWIIIVITTKFSSLGSILSVTATGFLFLIYEAQINIVIPFTIILIILYQHKDNIKRLIRKKEDKIKIL